MSRVYDSARLVADLQSPEAYPHRPASVEMVETHISWLFLTGPYVYKVKKPVNFGFLDFTTLERRLHFCRREVELNRRLSPEVYLGVVNVGLRGGRFAVEVEGPAVEYAVKMVQLPRDRVLKRLIRRGQVSAQDVRRIARLVADFHARAETGPDITRQGGYEAVQTNTAENFAQTEPYIGRTITREQYDDIRAYTLAFLSVREEDFRRREAQGRIRDCHGDLHTDQIFLTDGVQVIDCIEFNERFRYSDVTADIAFLAMDLDFLSRADLSRTFVEEYVSASGDEGVGRFLEFFKVYRAYVRGKVIGFTLDAPRVPRAQREEARRTAQAYFRLAQSYVAGVRRPTLICLSGLIGTGKTAQARRLADTWQIPHISSDVVRKELAGIPLTERRYVPFGTGIYTPEFTRRTYAEMFRRAGPLLRQGRSVILDASFASREFRAEAVRLAESARADWVFIHCTAPREVLLERLARREEMGNTPSDGRREILDRQAETFHPLDDVPEERLITVDTSGPFDDSFSALLRGLYSRYLATTA